MSVHQADGRRSTVHCKCGETDLLTHLDPVDNVVYLRCPTCDKDVVVAESIAANVSLTFETESVHDVDPELRGLIQEALDDE